MSVCGGGWDSFIGASKVKCIGHIDDETVFFRNENELRLPKEKLVTMCKLESVQTYVRRSDYSFYQALVEVLIPDVLRPIPSECYRSLVCLSKKKRKENLFVLEIPNSPFSIKIYTEENLSFGSGSLTQAIRNFAKTLEGWLKNATAGLPEELVKTKVFLSENAHDFLR